MLYIFDLIIILKQDIYIGDILLFLCVIKDLFLLIFFFSFEIKKEKGMHQKNYWYYYKLTNGNKVQRKYKLIKIDYIN